MPGSNLPLRIIVFAVLLGVASPALRAAGPRQQNQAAHLEREVAALTAFHELSLTDDQLTALRPLCKAAAVNAPASSPAASENYHGLMHRLREALVNGDDAKINQFEAKLDNLRDSEKIDLQIDTPISDAARTSAPTVLAMLSTSQIANYIATHCDDIPGANETLSDAIDECRNHQNTDYESMRSEAAEQVGLLMKGLDKEASKSVEKKVSDLLDRAKKLSDDEFKNQHDALAKEARQITSGADPVQGLRYWLEREMADVLSNPAAADAITARLQAGDSKH